MARGTQLLVDLGATWLRAELRAADGTLIMDRRVRSGGVGAIAASLRGFLEAADARPELVLLGVPGRILDAAGRARLTYLGSEGEVDFRRVFGDRVRRIGVINDLEAGVRGIAGLGDAELRRVQGDGPLDPAALDRFVVAMPGTGLGFGLGGTRLRGTASEAGNAPAAVDLEDADEVTAARAVRPAAGLPSYEDLTRAGALETVARALAAGSAPDESAALQFLVAGVPPHRRPAALLAAAGSSSCVARALAVQGRLLGRAVQGVALAVLPQAAFLAGGYLRAAWPAMEAGFREAFGRSAAHAAYLADLPIRIASLDDLNLRGLRAAAAEAR